MIMQVDHITVADASERLRVSPERIRQICRDNSLGCLITPRMRILSETDVFELEMILSRCEQSGVGRPRKKK